MILLPRALASAGGLSVGFIGATLCIAGCPAASTTTSYTPITGIEILPSSLLDGLQCGQRDDEVYQYVVVVSNEVDGGPSGPSVASNAFDCFTTGLFENLPASDGGGQQYFLQIFAFNQRFLPPDFVCPGGFSSDGGICPAMDADASLAEAGSATWATTCTATQQQGIPVLAVCQPLTPLKGDAGR